MYFLNGIFLWLVATGLRGSLLVLAVLALQLVLGRRLSPIWRYALWLPVLLVFVLPILPACPWSMENQLTLLLRGIPPVAAGSFQARLASVLAATVSLPSALGRTPFLSTLWLFGSTALATSACVGYRRTLRRIMSGAVPVDPILAAELAAAAQQVGLRRLPLVMVSTAVEGAAVTGLFRPMLLLPADFLDNFTPAETRLILLHELTHLRRRDLPLSWLLGMLQALHWFNPLLWFAFHQIRADREAACDAMVLSLYEDDRRADYGHVLLKMNRAKPLSTLSLGFAGILAPASLRSRLLAIARHRRTHPAWNTLGTLLVAGMILAGATRAPSSQEAEVAASGNAPEGNDTQVIARTGIVEWSPERTDTPLLLDSSWFMRAMRDRNFQHELAGLLTEHPDFGAGQ